MRLQRLTAILWAVVAVPPLLSVTGCSFSAREGAVFHPGPMPRQAVIFCDIERHRECAVPYYIPMGVELSVEKRVHALMGGKSSMYALDSSSEALGRCGGQPEKVYFQGPFPEGQAVALNADRIGTGTDAAGHARWNTVDAACKAWCDEHVIGYLGPWRDADGQPYSCGNVARASYGAGDGPFTPAATSSGIVDPSFEDPRKPAMKPVTWTNVVNLSVFGIRNSLKKESGTEAYDAGADSSATLAPGLTGAFEFTALETETERTAGFSAGVPDPDPSNTDIDYGVILRKTAELDVIEHGTVVLSGSTYTHTDRIRLVVVDGVVHYFKNGDLFYKSRTPVHDTLRASVSIRELNGTIIDAFVSF